MISFPKTDIHPRIKRPGQAPERTVRRRFGTMLYLMTELLRQFAGVSQFFERAAASISLTCSVAAT